MDILKGLAGGLLVGVIYLAWFFTFGTAKHRRWAREGKRPPPKYDESYFSELIPDRDERCPHCKR